MNTMTPDSNRRTLLKGLAALMLTAGATLWGILPARARAAFAERFPTRTVEKNTFRFDPARGDVVWSGGRRETYMLTLDGLVDAPAKLSYRDLRALPQVKRTADFHCVEGWSIEDAPWGGVEFRDLFAKVGIKPTARFAVFHSLGSTEPVKGLTHYVESLALADLLNPSPPPNAARRPKARPVAPKGRSAARPNGCSSQPGAPTPLPPILPIAPTHIYLH